MNEVFEDIDAIAGKIEPAFWQSHWPWLVAGAIAAIAILGIVKAQMSRRKPETPLEKARLRINSASLAKTDADFAFHTSAAVREYISDIHKIPAPARTTEEFLKIAKDSEKLDSGAKEKISKLLTLSDMAKFAAQQFGQNGRIEMTKLALDFVENEDAKINQSKK